MEKKGLKMHLLLNIVFFFPLSMFIFVGVFMYFLFIPRWLLRVISGTATGIIGMLEADEKAPKMRSDQNPAICCIPGKKIAVNFHQLYP